VTLRTLGAGGAVAAALATGWVGVVLLIVILLVPTIVLCWIVADGDRPQRLALLLTAWRLRACGPVMPSPLGPASIAKHLPSCPRSART
jgi:hypothetical protein